MTIHNTWHVAVAATWAAHARQATRNALRNARAAPRDPLARRIWGPSVGAWDGLRVMHGHHIESVLLSLLRNQYGYAITSSNPVGKSGFHYCDGAAGQRLVVSCIRGWNRKVTATDPAYVAVMAEAVRTGRKPVLLVFYAYTAAQVAPSKAVYPPGVSVITDDATDDVFGTPGMSAFLTVHMAETEKAMAEEVKAFQD